MSPVHPRVCGEHGRPDKGEVGDAGSSPRVRGTLLGVAERQTELRFIPACAGNTKRGARIRRADAGSSPRVRGTLLREQAQKLPRRFIPACAGNTSPSAMCNYGPTVHPRVCGEHP